MGQIFKYDVFISYASEHRFFAKMLLNLLKKIGLKVWFDEDAMSAGNSLPKKIKEGIDASSKMVAIWSQEYFEKTWTIIETEMKIDSDHSENRHTLIPILLKDYQLPAKFDELQDIINIDIKTKKNFLGFFKKLLEALDINKNTDDIKKMIERESNSYNPKEQEKSIKDELFEIYQLLEYEVNFKPTFHNTEIDLIIKKKWSSISIYEAGVRCYDKFFSYGEYDLLWNLLHSFKELPDKYRKIVISSEGFDTNIKKDLENSGFLCVTFSENEILSSLFPFESYKTSLNRTFTDWKDENWGGDDLFIEPRLIPENIDEIESSVYIKDWINNNKSKSLLLLGNLGTGKTTLIKYHINEYLNDFTLEKIGEKPFPLFISLGDIRRKASLEEIIMQHLSQVEKIFKDNSQNINITYKRMKFLIDTGKIILFFDAFDEMAYKMNWEMKLHNFNELLSACEEKGKVVIVCRTHYFKDESEEQKIRGKSRSDDGTPLLGAYKKHGDTEVVYLNEFDDEQITEYIKKARPKTWKKDVDKIKRIYREKEINEPNKKYCIPHLAHRPLLLNMIVRSLDSSSMEIRDSTPVDLYEHYIEMWLDREERLKQRDIILKDVKLALMVELSWRLWNEEDRKTIHYSKLANFIKNSDINSKNNLREDDLKLWVSDTMAASFLKRDAEGNFSFIHYSFLEFFVAKRLYNTIKQANSNDISEMLSKRRFGKTIIYFLTLLDRKSGIVVGQLKSILTAPYKRNISENALKMLYWYARTECNMEDTIDDIERFTEKTTHLMPKNAQLLSAKLDGMNIEGAYLHRADLRKADLKRANLKNAILIKADFNSADLSEARLKNVYAEGATFRESTLDKTNFQEAYLSRCDFTGAIKIEEANFHNAKGLDLGANHNIRIYQPIVQRAHCKKVESAAYDHRKFLCASGGEDGLVILHRFNDKRVYWVFEGHTDVVNAVVFSPDDKYIASGSGDGTLRVWDVNNLQTRYVFEGHSDVVNAAAFSSNGKWVASGGADRSIRIWDLNSGKKGRILDDFDSEVIAVSFLDNGNSVMGITRARKKSIWDVTTGRLLEDKSGVLTNKQSKDELLWFSDGHRSGINAVGFSQNGKMLASVSREDKSIRLWDLDKLTISRHIQSVGENAVAFSPDGTMIAGAGVDNKLRLWNIISGQELEIFKEHTNEISSVVFSANGRILISGSHDNTICLWDVRRGTKLKQFEDHEDWVRSVACSPKDNILVSGSWDSTIRLWDLEKKELINFLTGHTNKVITVAFSSDGKRLVSGSRDKTVRIWDVATGRQLRVMPGHTDSVKSVDFSNDGKTIASGSTDNTVRLWDANNGNHLNTLEGNLGHVYSVKFEPNGKYLVSAGEAGRLQFWDYRRKKLLLYCYCFGPDKWLNLLPDKCFDASKIGINYLGFIEKNKLKYYRASEPKIKKSFFNPEAVRNAFGSL